MKFEVIGGTPSLNEMVKKKIDAKQNTASTKAKRKFDVVFNEDHLAKAKEENGSQKINVQILLRLGQNLLRQFRELKNGTTKSDAAMVISIEAKNKMI